MPTDYRRQKAIGNAYLEEMLNKSPFEPFFIYDTLKHIGMIKNEAQRGHQEDAEEFLSSVLNGLNEEMIQLSKLLVESEENNEIKVNGKANGFSSNNSNNGLTDNDGNSLADEEDDANDDIWCEVGTSKHKSLPTRSVSCCYSCLSFLTGHSLPPLRPKWLALQSLRYSVARLWTSER